MDFKTRLKQLRKERGLTQQELSKKVGIPRSTIAGYETDVAEPDMAKISILANFFNVSSDYLLGHSDNPKTAEQLTTKDEKDIAKTMKKLKERLMNEEGLMFEGEALSPETIELLLTEIEQQERIVKITNKKYTPKKYR